MLGRTRRGRRLGALVVAALLAAAAPASAASSRVFATVPSPGQPEGIAVGNDGTVYVGTDAGPYGVRPDGTPPSKVFAFGPDGTLRNQWTIQGETRDGTTSYGLFGLALDRDGVIYAVEHNPPSIVTIDPATGAQHEYVRFHDVPGCQAAGRSTDCSATTGDLKSFPNYAVFAPDGTMYVTDIQQALIWRVPPGGGTAQVWFTDLRLEAVFGPNGAQFERDGRTLMFVMSTQSPNGGSPGLYTVTVQPDGSPGPLQQFWRDTNDDSADGLQIALSGNVWVTGSRSGQLIVLSPQGQETRRLPMPGDPQELPGDAIANVALVGTHALVTNHAWVVFAPPHWAVLDITPAEPGLPYFRPSVRRASRPTSSPRRLRLMVTPWRIVAGRRTLLRFRVRVSRAFRLRPVAGALVRFAGRRVRTGRDGRARMLVRVGRAGIRSARATHAGYLPGITALWVVARRR